MHEKAVQHARHAWHAAVPCPLAAHFCTVHLAAAGPSVTLLRLECRPKDCSYYMRAT